MTAPSPLRLRRGSQRFALLTGLALVAAACASAPAAEVQDPAVAPAPQLDLAAFADLDAERTLCVADALLSDAQQRARRAGRATNTSPGAEADRAMWFARRVEANRMHSLMQALRVTASSSESAQQSAQWVLANAVYFNPGDTEMRLWTGGRIGLTARQYEQLMTGAAERQAIMAGDAEGFRALADAHRDALGALVAAAGDASDPALTRAARRLAEQVRRDPVLELVYQEEFTLAYNFGDRCGPAPLREVEDDAQR